MLTYNEFIELRNKLIACEVSLDTAKKQLWDNTTKEQRSWHTTDWKERRSKILKEQCEICTSKEVLTIQHLSHPRKYNDLLTKTARAYTEEYINTDPQINVSDFISYVTQNYEYIPVPLCQNCKNKNPSKRVRKTPKYRCADCKHEFEEAIYRTINELVSIFYEDEEAYEVRDKCFVTKDKWKNCHSLSNIKYWMQRNLTKKSNTEAIEKEAFLKYLDENIKYLSFEDTITACKKCAYNFDMQKMELCPTCNTNYKGIQYASCIQCLPEDKRKRALEAIEFGKEWQEMHKNLGID